MGVLEGLTSYVEWLHCFSFMRVTVHYTMKLHSISIYGKQRKTTAAEKHIAVTLLVAEDHANTGGPCKYQLGCVTHKISEVQGLAQFTQLTLDNSSSAQLQRSDMDAAVQQSKNDIIAATNLLPNLKTQT